MSADCFIARSDRVAARMIGGEMMIMSGLDSSLFSLNETAAILWQAADGVTPLSRIVRERICPEFDVDEATAFADARELADELARHGILRVSSAPIEAGGSGGQS
jgi:predicted ATP-grasp superfamily ATP-dependent carboligase